MSLEKEKKRKRNNIFPLVKAYNLQFHAAEEERNSCVQYFQNMIRAQIFAEKEIRYSEGTRHIYISRKWYCKLYNI